MPKPSVAASYAEANPPRNDSLLRPDLTTVTRGRLLSHNHGEHDDHGREGPLRLVEEPNLVVGAELACVDRESGRDDEPGDDGDRGAESEERPARVLYVRAKVEQAREDHDQPDDQEWPLADEPRPADRGLGPERLAEPA